MAYDLTLITTWSLRDDLGEYDCHLCGGRHVMEPLASCPSADALRQPFNVHMTWKWAQVTPLPSTSPTYGSRLDAPSPTTQPPRVVLITIRWDLRGNFGSGERG